MKTWQRTEQALTECANQLDFEVEAFALGLAQLEEGEEEEEIAPR